MAGAAQPRQPALTNAPASFFHTFAVPLLGWEMAGCPSVAERGK